MKRSDAFRGTQGGEIPGFEIIKRISDETRHVTGYRSLDGKEMLVGFDCTLGATFSWKNRFLLSADWWRNLMFWPKGFTVGSKKYQGEAGFVSEYQSFRDELLNWADIYRPTLIRPVGFSQGETHAVQYERDLIENIPGVQAHGLGFGGPRIYEAPAAHEFNVTIEATAGRCSFTQIRLWGDPVPHSVPALLGYRHVGKVEYIGKFRPFLDLSIHNGDSYIKALESLE